MEAGFQKLFLGAALHPVASKISAFSSVCFNKSLLPQCTNIYFLVFQVTIGKKVHLVISLTERGNSSIFEFWPEETKKFKGVYVVSPCEQSLFYLFPSFTEKKRAYVP